MDIGATFGKFSALAPIVRRLAVCLLAVYAALQLSKSDLFIGQQLLIACVIAIFVAIEFVPRAPRYLKKPKQEVEVADASLQRNNGVREIPKRSYSQPRHRRIESRHLSGTEWESSGEDDSFRTLRPFYLVYRECHFNVVAVCLRFDGDRDYRAWQPVADLPSRDSESFYTGDNYQWKLIGYVPPGVRFDAKLQLIDPQSRPSVTFVHDLIALEGRALQSVHLRRITSGQHFVARA